MSLLLETVAAKAPVAAKRAHASRRFIEDLPFKSKLVITNIASAAFSETEGLPARSKN
jgi:hypothetical protein